MTDSHGSAIHGPTYATYMTVFVVLSICTIASFLVNWILGVNFQSASIIMGVAFVKALFVTLIFMHLKYDWAKLFFILLPTLTLAALLIVVLVPDLVWAWQD